MVNLNGSKDVLQRFASVVTEYAQETHQSVVDLLRDEKVVQKLISHLSSIDHHVQTINNLLQQSELAKIVVTLPNKQTVYASKLANDIMDKLNEMSRLAGNVQPLRERHQANIERLHIAQSKLSELATVYDQQKAAAKQAALKKLLKSIRILQFH